MATPDPIQSQLITEMEQLLQAMQRGPGGERALCVSQFLSRFVHFALRLESPLAARADEGAHEEAQGFLQRARGPLQHAALDVEAYARGLAEMNHEAWEVATDWGPFSIDRWSRVCTERSALEFLAEHFPDLFSRASNPRLFELLDESDEDFKRKVDSGEATPQPNQMPADVPGSYWWWRYEGE